MRRTLKLTKASRLSRNTAVLFFFSFLFPSMSADYGTGTCDECRHEQRFQKQHRDEWQCTVCNSWNEVDDDA
jgi:hypothetical protein